MVCNANVRKPGWARDRSAHIQAASTNFSLDLSTAKLKVNTKHKACPYPFEFCCHVAPILYDPSGHGKALVVGPVVSMEKPPGDHYLTHLPQHSGCKACNNCKVQRKHFRDKVKAKNRKLERSIKLAPLSDGDVPEAVPKNFGDLITSDSIFVLRKSSTPPRPSRWFDCFSHPRSWRRLDDGIPSKEQVR